MDLDELRRYCLSFPGATEGLQWGDNLLFRVGQKIFAITSLDSVPQALTLKCTPERCAELLEIEGISRAPYLARHDWVELEHLNVLGDSELREVIAESYHNVRSKLPRSVQAKLDGASSDNRRRSRQSGTKKRKRR